MSTLIDDIRRAQRDAGEAVVMRHLEQLTPLVADIHTPGVPRGHGAITGFSLARVNEIVKSVCQQRDQEATHLRGQLLVLASLLEQALEVVRNVEAEDSDEGEQLMNLINTGTEAVRAVLTEHAMGVPHG